MTHSRILLLSILSGALTLSGCASQTQKGHYTPSSTTKPSTTNSSMPSAASSAPWQRPTQDRAPLRAVQADTLRDATPEPVTLSRYGNKTPYDVLGKRYYLLPTAAGYSEVGVGSWYGEKFHGQPTSTMEPYDLYEMTAAHKSLPIPTYARVTNLENNRSVIVRINDRGPFVDDRIIDLSYAAAVKIGYAEKGTARVRVETLSVGPFPMVTQGETRTPQKYGSANRTALTSRTPPTQNTHITTESNQPNANQRNQAQIFLQVGAFSNSESAHLLQNRLSQLVSAPVTVAQNDSSHFRVHVGPFNNEDNARRAEAQIRSKQLGNPLLIRR
ncbi:Rare lipoprotein A [gamma proteobacterium HdN1]|nr:Rare lipoprotein A [gamma proteobacterium HdN1]